MEQNNRYAGVDLLVPTSVHQHVSSLVARSDREQRPFRRQVDLWWAGMCLGLYFDERTPSAEQMTKFHTGVIFGSDPWRITHLDLLGIALMDVEVLDRPGEVIGEVQEYANFGMDWIVEQTLGEGEPTLSLSHGVQALLASDGDD